MTVRTTTPAVTGAVATLALVTLVFLSCTLRRSQSTVSEVPKEIHGWVVDDEVRTYDRRTLFKYIDGGAELYLAYRFRSVQVYTYRKVSEPDIVLDLYDMGLGEDAFGVFTCERGGDDVGIGQASEYSAGLLRFFKGRFFVSIMALGETSESGGTILALGRAVADGIQGTGELPDLLFFLPQDGLLRDSIRYFYAHTLLNLHYYLAEEDILLLDRRSRAVLAQYALADGEPYLLLVRYESTGRAEAAFRSFLAAYMPDAREGIVQTEDGQWTGAHRCSRFLVVVLDAPSEGSARSLLDATRVRLEVNG